MRNEVRERSRSQIMETLLGHGKECAFYSTYNGKPLQSCEFVGMP